MKVFNSLQDCSHKVQDPWPYFTVTNFFTESYLDSIYKAFDEVDFIISEYDDDPCRLEFPFNKTVYDKYKFVRQLTDSFKCRSNEVDLYKLTNTWFKDTYLRISLWLDLPTYVLPIHSDANYKMFTLQIYIPHNDEELGTNIYDQNKQLHSIIPFERNNGYWFLPNRDEPISWHGFTQPIKTRRQTIVINIFDKKQYCNKQGYTDESWLSM
jgi:hypothetical protein